MQKRKGYATMEQQIEANKRYRKTEAGKTKTLYNNYKSNCKNFILKYATDEDLKMIEEFIKIRKENKEI